MVIFVSFVTLLLLGCKAGLPFHEEEDICRSGCTYLKLMKDYKAADLKTIKCTGQCYKPGCLEKCVKAFDVIQGDITVLDYNFQGCLDKCLKKTARQLASIKDYLRTVLPNVITFKDFLKLHVSFRSWQKTEALQLSSQNAWQQGRKMSCQLFFFKVFTYLFKTPRVRVHVM